jgi:C4-dicarboxylate-binding protein DctP
VEEQNKQYVIEAGGVVRELTPEQRQLWVDALKPVWKKFEKDIGSDLIEAALASNNK